MTEPRAEKNQEGPVSITEAFGEQVKDSRNRRGWTQKQLANELERLGVSIAQGSLARIEQGTRAVPIDEAIAISLALGVAPIHLILPRQWGAWWVIGEDAPTGTLDPAPVQLAPNYTANPLVAADWFRGVGLLGDGDPTTYITHVSDYEQAVYRSPGLSALRHSMRRLELAMVLNDIAGALNMIEDIRDELERQEKQLRRLPNRPTGPLDALVVPPKGEQQ